MGNTRNRYRKLWVMLLTVLAVMIASSAVAWAAPKISRKKVTLIKGQKVTIKVTGTKKKVTWKSNKKSVAAVTKKGKVTAKKKGTAVITAKVGKKKLKCTVTVETPKLSRTKVSLKEGKRLTLKLNGTKQTVKWSTSNKKVATVTKKGVVKAVKAGKAKITATVLKKKYTCTVTVKASANTDTQTTDSGTTDSGTTDSGTTDSGTTDTGTDTSGFVFARDCKVVTGTQRIYIEFKINTETTTAEELEAAGYTVKDGVASDTVECETATYIFTKLPQTLEEIKSIPLTTKFGPMAASICACAAFDTEKYGISYMYTHPIYDMMEYLNGPSEKTKISNPTKSDIFLSMRDTLLEGKMAYFNGATPANGYQPTKPYTLKLVHGPYYIPAKNNSIAYGTEPEKHMILISFAGDDSQRYVDVYHSSDGNWYTWARSWLNLVGKMKDVSTGDSW